MHTWMIRGLVMSAVHTVARVLLGMAIVSSPFDSTWWKTLALIAVIAVALIGGLIDGVADGRKHSEPEDYNDLTVRWLSAGLLAGLITGIACWILGNHVVDGMGQNPIYIEVFVGGAFTALLIFVPALLGAAVGRRIGQRGNKQPAAVEPAEPQDALA
ncbi:B-4DMT family transporter [Jongsikchunia kroppenstedtii]|uniref:B-4DMT family transporter n=1 Tax=Jongsikchunia kroppenstedtii TaxID=1121721 RepID=UPI000372DEC6|nr:B-4DMT family transporter [Jongsikchunia kroppenstedtii]